ncbi:MAG TPA: glycosyltransferase family 4 protein [Bacteroidales bacterium]
MKIKPKIGVIGLKGLPAYGGAATVGENIIDQLQNEFDFTVYSISSHTNLQTGKYKSYYQLVFRKLPFKKINTLYYYILSAFHALFFGKYKLIHLHHRDAAFVIPLLKIRFKVIVTTHGSFVIREKWRTFEWFFSMNEHVFVKKADVVTCVSMNEKRLYKEKLNLDVQYIPNGFNPFLEKDLVKIDKSNYLFFGAGRIIKSKGLEILIEALQQMSFKGKLIVAGDLDQTPDYKKEILRMANGLDIEFLGLIKDKNELLSYIQQSRLFIFPSSVEAMSMMLLEGASVKAQIVCSDIQENRDIFNENEVLFFKTNDSANLSEKIQFALMHESEMQEKSKNAYKKLISNHDWKKIAGEYSDVYNFCLKN